MIMKQTRVQMGMPITIEINGGAGAENVIHTVFGYFEYIDEKFSTYKDHSEISLINRQELTLEKASQDMKTVFRLAEQTRLETNGYFDIRHKETYDPSGLVKGWAIYNASGIIYEKGFENFYVEAGGDIQMSGKNSQGQNWRVGIRNPFNPDEIVKVLSVTGCGVATSGTYVRGQHIYDPKNASRTITDILSLTVIGPDIYEADRFATAGFAMGRSGIDFIESMPGLEGYMIDEDRQATYTSGFRMLELHDAIH
jgi:FAD:protein FMN transferase